MYGGRFCLSLEQLQCYFIQRESYSAGSLDNDPSGHSIFRSSQKQTCVVVASKHKLLLSISFLAERTNSRPLGERKKKEDLARY